MTEQKRAAIIGLGSMGYGMAQSCLRAGLQTYGFDVVPAQMERSVRRRRSRRIGQHRRNAGRCRCRGPQCGPDRRGDVRSEGRCAAMRKGAVVMACATVPPDFARQMETRCNEGGVHYLDAPISGGSIKAANGQLSIMASGTAEAFAAARPVLDATAETVFELGDTAGAGSAMKAVNQLLAGVHIAAMAEALTFGMTQGVDPEQFVEVISKCAGTSWMLENRAPHIVAGDYTPHSSGQHLAQGPWHRVGHCPVCEFRGPDHRSGAAAISCRSRDGARARG